MSCTPMYLPSSEEQVKWVLMPVRVPASATLSSAPNSADPQYPSFVPAIDLSASSAMWDQQQIFPPYSPALLGSDAHGEAFDIDLALRIDAAIHPDFASASGLGDFPSSLGYMPLVAGASFPSALPLHSDGVLAGDSWQVDSPSSTSSSSAASPATTSPVCLTDSPGSTPPTAEVHLCSDPSCFETFSRAADRKRHERKHRQNFCCPLCQKPHLDRRALDRHLWSRHEKYAVQVGAKSEKTKCRMCDYVSRADNVRRHERSRHSTNTPQR